MSEISTYLDSMSFCPFKRTIFSLEAVTADSTAWRILWLFCDWPVVVNVVVVVVVTFINDRKLMIFISLVEAK